MEGMQYAPPGVLPPCMCTHSALRDKRNELNHLGDCSRAIDFMGHQIKVGLAEHMPFSTRQSLSFSQINSSNYAAPPTEINPEAIVSSSRNWNGEVRCRWCNLSKVVAASLTFFFPLHLSCFNLQERFFWHVHWTSGDFRECSFRLHRAEYN